MKRLLSFVLTCALICTMLAGCSSSASPSESKEPVQASDGSVHREQLTVAIEAEPAVTIPWEKNDNWTPHTFSLVYENLFQIDKDNNLQPCLATDWEVIDNTHYRFHLRQGVKFHNGNDFTADDVLYTISMNNEAPACLGTLVPIKLDECVKEDDYTVVIATDGEYPNFLTSCALYIGSIVDKEAYEADPEGYAANPVGTGPFVFDEWSTGDYIKLNANKNWWGGSINFDTLMLRVIPEATTRAIEVETGGVDIAFIGSESVESLKSNPNINVDTITNAQTMFLTYNCTQAPFDDINVRRAIVSAIDRDKITEVCWYGMGQRSTSPIPPQANGYSEVPDAYPYDVEAAKKYLSESAYPNGFTFTLSFRPVNNNDRAVTLIQNYLAEIGITAELEQLDTTNFSHKITTGQFDMMVTGWTVASLDAAETMTMFGTDTAGMAGTGNANYFSDPELDQLLKDACYEMDSEKRTEMYQKVVKILNENVVDIQLYLGKIFIASNSSISNLNVLSVNKIVRYQDVTFSE